MVLPFEFVRRQFIILKKAMTTKKSSGMVVKRMASAFGVEAVFRDSRKPKRSLAMDQGNPCKVNIKRSPMCSGIWRHPLKTRKHVA